MDTAQARFRDGYSRYLMHAFLAALAVHFMVFYLFPPFDFSAYEPPAAFITTVIDEPDPPPVPEEPKEIAGPVVKPVPLIDEKEGTEDIEIPVTSPRGIEDLRMPASSTPADDRGFIPWSEAPVLTRFGAPVYPEFARRAGLEGTVLLEVTVGTSGRVESASVIDSDVNPPMEKAAVAAAMRFEFRPATQRGIPVRATVRVPVRFRLR